MNLHQIIKGLMLLLCCISVVYGQSPLDEKIKAELGALKVTKATEADPLSINATAVTVGDSVAILIKTNMAPGWHTYHYVPTNMPYVQTEYVLRLPENVADKGAWTHSRPSLSTTDQGVLIHENNAWYVYKTVRKDKKPVELTVGLYYQICDLRQCLPPTEKTVTLQLHIDQR